VGQAAEYLGIAQSSFRSWVDAGRLESFTTPGGHRRVTRAALDQFLAQRSNDPRRPRYHVLVIDDDADVRTMIRASLEREGFDVTEAASAADGVVQINARIPDLLMIDICMPGTDGWQLLRKLRERMDVSELPVLVFSGSDSLAATDSRGAQAYAFKPFDPSHLVAQAHLLCEHCRTAIASSG
jgi:excisionase family DNA binding protein